MAGLTGEQIATTLLRALPVEVAELLLSRMLTPVANRLRSLWNSSQVPPADPELDAALAEFFDLLRIIDRGFTLAKSAEYRPVAKIQDEVETVQLTPENPIEGIRSLSAEQIVRAVEGESPAAIALLLTCLDQNVAASVLKVLPPEIRPDITLRYTAPGNRNHGLIEQLAKAISTKGRQLAEVRPETSAEDRISQMAAMLRQMPRGERINVLLKVEESNQELASKIREKLYTFEDLLRVEDRGVQALLAQLNMKTLATSMKGASEKVTAKLSNNLSIRAREMLTEEVGLLGNVGQQQINEAQAEVLYLLRQFEEEGKITLGD